MHLTQQKQTNHHQMCPPPIGSSAAWFMNFPASGLAQPPAGTTYHNYNNFNSNNHQATPQHQSYYDVNASSIPSVLSSNVMMHNASTTSPNVAMQTSRGNPNMTQHNHLQHHPQQHLSHNQQQQHQIHNQHHQSHHRQQSHNQQVQNTHQQQQTSSGNQYGYSYATNQMQTQNSQQYTQVSHHQQPLTIQQTHSHVHQQQSPILSQQTQSQLSPITTVPQPRPSPTLRQHTQPSPNYQQHSPHLTSPALQPSPILHTPSQQHSPSSRPQPTPPHHTPTPLSQHHGSRPASVKEQVNISSFLSKIPQTEVRMLEFNRKLQNRPAVNYKVNTLPSRDQSDDLIWWDEFVAEFFKDDATLSVQLQIDGRPIVYTLQRSLIPKFFRSFYVGGAMEMNINLRNSKETLSGNNVMLNCDQASLVTKNILNHPKLSSTKVVVCAEGHLLLEFVGINQDSLQIKSWKFNVHVSHEYIDRSITTIGLPTNLLSEPTTVQGMPKATISYLRMCSILEPMQDIMAQQKITNLCPKACLKKYLFEKHRFTSEEETKVTATTRRRKRKQEMSLPNTKPSSNNKKTKASIVQENNIADQVVPSAALELPVMSTVGDLSQILDYHDENERQIDTIKNANYSVVRKTEKEIDEIPYENTPNNLNITDKSDTSENSNPPIVDKAGETKLVIHDIDRSTAQISPSHDKAPIGEDETLNEDLSRPVSEEPSEKENNCSAMNEELSMNSTGTQSENHFMNSIPEEREDDCKVNSIQVDALSKLPPNINNKMIISTNGTGSKQNRRRSSERKESLREGLMRTSDFVISLKDLKLEHPSLWRITTGNNLLQQFEPKNQNGIILYENTNQYAGWNPEIRKDYIGVDVKLTQHTRNQITVERLLLNLKGVEESDAFHDKHFLIYLQILISTALDPKFWESIENEPHHHDYFLTSRKIIEDIIKRMKLKLSSTMKLDETALKNFEKYPNLIIKPVDEDNKGQICRACNINTSTQIVTFGNRSYDLHSYKSVKITNESMNPDDRGHQNNLCESCLEMVKLYSEIHHMSWKFYNIAREKVEQYRGKNKPINVILGECLSDEEWVNKNYTERDELWSKVEELT